MPEPRGPRLEVYQTDAEAYEAAADVVAARLREAAAARGKASAALAGGRAGRGVQIALAARGDVPWAAVDWYWSDERCVPVDDKRSLVRQAEADLLVPRGVAAARIHRPPLELDEPAAIARRYADILAALGSPPAFDVLMLDVTPAGQVAALAPGSAGLGASGWVAAVSPDVADPPPVPRITVTPPVLDAARHVVVTITGDDKAAVVGAALREPHDLRLRPVQLVLPSARVTWVVDRAAAAELLRDAVPAPQ